MRVGGALKLLLATSIVACCASQAMADTYVGTVTSFRGFGWNQADIGGSVTLDLQTDWSVVDESFQNNVLTASSPLSAASILDGVGAGINLEPNGPGSGHVVEKVDYNNNTVTLSATTSAKPPSNGFTGSVFSLSLLIDGINDTFEVVRNAFVDGMFDRKDSGAMFVSNVSPGSGVSAPEIDAATAPSAFALLLGALAIVSARKSTKRVRI